jgi:hypothetical protein
MPFFNEKDYISLKLKLMVLFGILKKYIDHGIELLHVVQT